MEAPAIDAPAADWLVYGDALQEQGDPRGELIGLSLAVAEGRMTADVRDAYIKEHAVALLGPNAAPYLETYRFDDWRFCIPFAATVRVGASDGDRDLRILDSPIASELRAFTLVGHTDGQVPANLTAVMKSLERRRPKTMRSFTFVDERASRSRSLISPDWEPNPNLVTFGPLRPFFAFAEELHLEVADSHQLELAPIDAPELRAFTLNSLRFGEYDNADTMVNRLLDASLPKLERFAVRLTEAWTANIPLEEDAYVPVYSQRYAEEAIEDEEAGEEPRSNRYETDADYGDCEGVPWDDQLGDLLVFLVACPLKHLAFTGFTSSRSLLEGLARVGFAPTLETLDLSDSTLEDSDAMFIAEHPARFGQLKKIIVERTNLTAAGAQSLEKLGAEVVHSEGIRAYRYVVGSE